MYKPFVSDIWRAATKGYSKVHVSWLMVFIFTLHRIIMSERRTLVETATHEDNVADCMVFCMLVGDFFKKNTDQTCVSGVIRSEYCCKGRRCGFCDRMHSTTAIALVRYTVNTDLTVRIIAYTVP